MSFQESHSLNITVVGPDDAPTMALPIAIQQYKDSDNFYSASPEQPELSSFTNDGNSSGGCSTPITPFTTLLDLSAVDTHLSPTEGHDYHGLSTPLSPFSPSSLSPSFDGLTLSDGYSTHENSMFNSNDKNMHIPSLDFTAPSFQDDSGYSATHPALSLMIPAPPVAGADNDFMKDIFQFDENEANLTAVEQTLSPSFQYPVQDTLPAQPNLQRVNRVPQHNRGFSVAGTSWTGPNTASTHLTSPSLCFTPSDYNATTNSSSLLSPPTPYGGDDVFLGNGTTTVQRRHSHTGGRSSSRAPERGRSDMRSHATSASSSRRSSPYPSPLLPTLSPDTLSPSQIWDTSNVTDHLTVPQDGGAAISRRHSFTGYSTHSAPPPYEVHQQQQQPGGLSQLPFHDEDATSPGGSALRKVASQAGINASVKRRTKEAKFVCEWCQQTFTTNHNLKNHRNVHLGIKEHGCQKCGREFTTQSVLARHMKTCKATS
ncbi:hypothetical protein MD484_g1917, partial [Candolleomyces efflorescens]